VTGNAEQPLVVVPCSFEAHQQGQFILTVMSNVPVEVTPFVDIPRRETVTAAEPAEKELTQCYSGGADVNKGDRQIDEHVVGSKNSGKKRGHAAKKHTKKKRSSGGGGLTMRKMGEARHAQSEVADLYAGL
jgi:hypothetical protein